MTMQYVTLSNCGNGGKVMRQRRFSLGAAIMLGTALLWVSAVGADDKGKRKIDTPHEVHAFDQVLYIPNNAWKCHIELGCVVCKNISADPAIAEVKASYKRTDANLREDQYKARAANLEIREHCVNPGQEIWACYTGGYVIEPEPGVRPNPDGIRDPAGCPHP